MGEPCKTSCHRSALGGPDPLQDALAEIERLRAAIQWALGAGPAPDGSHFGDKKPEATGGRPYWWRSELREMALVTDYRT